MAKIAVEGGGCTVARPLRQGGGWMVEDVVCSCSPRDRAFEERHELVRIAVVAEGTFQYRGSARNLHGRDGLMTPGSLLLGNPGDHFECRHDHGTGDRCIAFGFAPEYIERIAADAGLRSREPFFPAQRLPPLRVLSRLIVRAYEGLNSGIDDCAWQELGAHLAAEAVRIVRSLPASAGGPPAGAVARVTRVLRELEEGPLEKQQPLSAMAKRAGLSLYHFLRTFEAVTGITPHQYLLRLRLRKAAQRLTSPEKSRVLDIAFDCGFGDVSNFNRAFRAEFGVSPSIFRR